MKKTTWESVRQKNEKINMYRFTKILIMFVPVS